MSEERSSDAATAAELEVVRNDDRSRYEAHLRGELTTVIDFRRHGDVLSFTHTGTEPQWRGRGFAEEVTRQALEDVRSAHLRVRPICPFTVDYFDRHPDVADLEA